MLTLVYMGLKPEIKVLVFAFKSGCTGNVLGSDDFVYW